MVCTRVPDGGSILQFRAYKSVVGSLSNSYILFLMFLFKTLKVLLAFDVMQSMWELHDMPLDMSTLSTSHRKQPPGHGHAVCMKNVKFS